MGEIEKSSLILGTGARFWKVSKLFGRISETINLFVSLDRDGFQGTKLCSYAYLSGLVNLMRDQLSEIGGS